MTSDAHTELESFVRQMEAAPLAALLLELCDEHDAVKKRVVRLMLVNNPKRLTAVFKKTLKTWCRETTYYRYSDAGPFGTELHAWLGQVESELLPNDPAAALQLVEAFIQADGIFYNRADDSGGVIGDAIETACRIWLKAAKLSESPTPPWTVRLEAMVSADEYGSRKALYEHANELLDEAALRQLVAQHMTQLTEALAQGAPAGRRPARSFKHAHTLSLLAKALHDPDVLVAAALAENPQPDAHRMQEFVQAYLECGLPADAVLWLDKDWGGMDSIRQGLLAEALAQLGRQAESAAILQSQFEAHPSVGGLRKWLAALPPGEQLQATAAARELAIKHPDPVAAACVLVEVGEHALAAATILASPGKLQRHSYTTLLPLAQAMDERHHVVAATALYRTLLDDILNRGYWRAYHHALRYWQRLEQLAAAGADLGKLGMHEAYVADVRSKHARKVSFWAYVSGKRQVESIVASDDDDDEHDVRTP
jgi:hypothetical protein